LNTGLQNFKVAFEEEEVDGETVLGFEDKGEVLEENGNVFWLSATKLDDRATQQKPNQDFRNGCEAQGKQVLEWNELVEGRLQGIEDAVLSLRPAGGLSVVDLQLKGPEIGPPLKKLDAKRILELLDFLLH
jgi:hypothetical protein